MCCTGEDVTSLPAITIAADAGLEPDAAHDRRRLARSAAMLSIAMIAANAATYLLAVVGSRTLPAANYGLLGSLLALLAIVSVPGLALQAVVARRVAVAALPIRRALTLGLLLGVGCSIAGLALIPALRPFLHAGSTWGLAATMLVALPLTAMSALQGWLQGRERFGELSVVVLLAGGARLAGGVVPLALGADAAVTVAGIAAALVMTATAAGWFWLRRVPTPESAASPPTGIGWRELGTAVWGLGGLLVLSNLDLLFARHLLPGRLSGHYAAAGVIARVAFWLPQAIALTVLPRLTHPGSRRAALRDAAVATAVIGAICVGVTAVAGGWLAALTFGSSYRSIGSPAWLFALQGGALAMGQLLVVDDIARRRRGTATLILAAAAIEIVWLGVSGPASITGIIAVAAVVAGGIAVTAIVRLAQWPASSHVRPTPTETSSGTVSG